MMFQRASKVVVITAMSLCYGTAYGLTFSWSFTNNVSGNVVGPVSGTIGFSTLVSGSGGTHAPDSFSIDAASGHSISNGYTLGNEVIGSPLWVDITMVPSFEFTTANVAISGDFAFKDVNNDTLLMDFRPPSLNSFFRSPGSPNLITKGNATWTVVIPEPGTLVLLTLGGLMLVRRSANIRCRT